MTRLTCDERGMVVGFAHHDGTLDGVLIDGSDVHIALRSSSGDRRVLTLRGVTTLELGGFREGNIVAYMFMSRTADDAVVFSIDSSYGAELRATCRDAEISDTGVTLGLVQG
jgi:hypothetical protein